MGRWAKPITLAMLLLAMITTGLALHQWQRQAQTQSALAAATPSAVDVGFAQSMSLHHQQAVQIAQMMTRSDSTAMTGLARNIIGTQLLELGEMRG